MSVLHSLIKSVEVRKRVTEPVKPPGVKYTLELNLSALTHGKSFHVEVQKELTLMPAFLASDVLRYITIDPVTGRPAYRSEKNNLMVPFEDPIILYSILKAEDESHRLVIISTTTRTFYLNCRKIRPYFFVITQSSVDVKEAVINLYENNLNKGPELFNKTKENIGDGFYSALFNCVADEPLVTQFTVKTPGGTPVSSRLYIDRDHPTRNMISVCGWVQDFDLDTYPVDQIRRGYFGRPKIRTEDSMV